MVKKFKNLVLTKDRVFNESIEVEGNITCKGERWSLTVAGNIDAWGIDAMDIVALDINTGNINAWDIDAENINARDIVTGNIDARDIDAMDIVCEKRTKKTTKAKTFARIFIQNRSKNKRKEW